MMNLNYEMALTLCPIFKIVLSGSKIKREETLTTIPPIHVYINRVNNRSVLKIKDGYKLELQTPETMKLISTTKKKQKQTTQKLEKECRVLKWF